MNTAKLTPARRRALQALAGAGRALRVSNETNDACVYWQTADWLSREELAVVTHGPTVEFIQLTDAGQLAAGAL